MVAVVQARAGSSRLPEKVLADVDGRPALALLLARLSRAAELDQIVLATSTESADDRIAAVALEADVPVVRGPLDDVLERYRHAVELHPADGVVRITGDCTLIDPEVVDRVVGRWREGDEAYVANVIERTFPKGLDTEVLTSEALAAAAAEALEPYDREHVTPFVRSRPERFPQANVRQEPSYGGTRLVLDTAEDLESIKALVRRAGPDASMAELLNALGAQPDR